MEMEAVVVTSLRRRLGDLPGIAHEHEPFTIFRIPAAIRRRSPELYEPTMVAIGPYHHANPDLRAMEEHKWRYLRDLLARFNHTNLEELVHTVSILEAAARRCYSETPSLSTTDFVEMLALDGCFIIEFLIKYRAGDWEPMLLVGWSIAMLKSDLVLLENQIPFFILDHLGNLLLRRGCLTIDDVHITEVRWLATEFLGEITPANDFIFPEGDFDHLLHLYHECYVSKPMNPDQQPRVLSASKRLLSMGRFLAFYIYTHVPVMKTASEKMMHSLSFWSRFKKRTRRLPKSLRAVPCASQLQEAGVQFRRKVLDEMRPGSFLDITFIGGVMDIPRFEIFNETKAFFVNLIAYEQCKGLDKNFTSYAFFMDGLVDNEQDVAVLETSGVLVNNLSSSAEVASFINQLCECSSLMHDENYLHEISEKVWSYYSSKWPRWRAKLMRDYFSNPWAVISLMAALFLLGLTMVQTFFAIYAYLRPPS